MTISGRWVQIVNIILQKIGMDPGFFGKKSDFHSCGK